MIGLVLHKEDSFVSPIELTSDPNSLAAHAYIGVLLTETGSVALDPTMGTNIGLGMRNVIKTSLQLQEANSKILDVIGRPYNIMGISILSISESEDSIVATVQLNFADSSSTSVDIAL